jgi:signal transduction histidine kinase
VHAGALILARYRRVLAPINRPMMAERVALGGLALLLVQHDVHEGPPPYRWLLTVGLLLPLVWRRHSPLLVFALVATVAAVQWELGVVELADVALPFALFGVAARHTRPWTVALGGAVLEIGAALAALRWSPPGREFPVFVLLSGMTVAAVGTGLAVRTQRRYVDALRDRAARAERERDQLAQLAVATERSRIAREMHDIVAHTLSVMISLSNGAAYTVRADPQAAESAARQAAVLGSSAQAEMRRLLGVLRDGEDTALHPQPQTAALDDLLAAVRLAGLPTRFVVVGKPPELPASAQLTIYRLIQEALTNVVRHAGPGASASVTLRWSNHLLDLEIVDDGHASGEPVPGHGLTGMRERAALFGGHLTAGPRVDGGWRVHTVLNFQEPRL